MRASRKLFARPWRLIEHAESFAVMDPGERPLAFVYFEDEAVRARSTKRMSKDDPLRLATQIMKLPELLEDLKRLCAARDEPA